MENLLEYGIIFNGHHSREFGLYVLSKEMEFPEKNKILKSIPHSNIVYDFTQVYGQTYSERAMDVVFYIPSSSNRNKESLYIIWTKITDWLMKPNQKSILYDDIMQEYYYLAEVQQAPGFEEFRSSGKLSVRFQCYPFRIYSFNEGHDKWDLFNFELDIAQKVRYEVNNLQKIVLYNVGVANITTTIKVDAPMDFKIRKKWYRLSKGENTLSQLYLMPGVNEIEVIGRGSIEFIFNKEVI